MQGRLKAIVSKGATAVLALVLTFATSAQTMTVVEYYHAGFDHYFVTSLPDEVTKLDNGTFAGWARTGERFFAYPMGTGGTAPTCRFFSTAFGLKSSHFYTPSATECATVKANPSWQFEANVFAVMQPSVSGACGTGTQPLYRLYNNGKGGAPNHRYTTSATTRSSMIAKGWIPEGAGTLGVIACVPVSGPATLEGMWIGMTSTGSNVAGFVLDTRESYFLYTQPYSSITAGVIQGTVAVSGGAFTSSNARDFSFVAGGVFGTTLSGTFVPRTSLVGAAASTLGSATFSLAYSPAYEQPASLVDASGVYVGTASSSFGNQQVTVTVSANGAVTGSLPGCSFAGSAARHANVNVFDISIKFGGGQCLFGTSTLKGIAFYDSTTRVLYAVAPNAARTDGFLLIASKP